MKTPVLGLALGLLIAFCTGGGVAAGGLEFGPTFYTLDLSEAFSRVSIAAADAFDAVDIALADLGFSPAERTEIRTGLDEGLATVEETLEGAPTTLPVPLLGGSFEIGLPLLVIDGVRVSFALVSDAVIRAVAGMAGLEIPEPLFQEEIDEPEFQASVRGDIEFSTWRASTELVKRFDGLLAALDLALGVHVLRGVIEPLVEYDVPAELTGAVGDGLAALHLDGLTWTSFGLHASVGLEIGPPFFRLGASLRFDLPISTSSGWWGIGVAGIGGRAGIRIRY
jgi:hypothetical protein